MCSVNEFNRLRRRIIQTLGLVALAASALSALAQGTFQDAAPVTSPNEVTRSIVKQETAAHAEVPSGTILRVKLAKTVRVAKLRPGDEFDGDTARAIYVVSQKAIPAGSRMHFVVDSIENKPRRDRSFTNKLTALLTFGLLNERETVVHLRSGRLTLADGESFPVEADVVRATNVMEIRAKGSEATVGKSALADAAEDAPGMKQLQAMKEKRKELRQPELTLALREPLILPLLASDLPATMPATPAPEESVSLPAGTRARLLLLTKLDAAKNKAGDPFDARLVEPIEANGRVVLPEGTHFYGRVSGVMRARIGRRPASMLLTLERVELAGGKSISAPGALSGVVADHTSNLKMDEEGKLRPGHPSKKELLRDIALAWAPGKGVNDAIDATLPLTANVAGLSLNVAMFFIHRGHDVVLPMESEIEMTFTRELSLSAAEPVQSPAQP